MTTPAKRANYYAKAQADPVWWIRKMLGAEPWDHSARVIESVRDNAITAWKSAHGVSKSWTAAHTALWFLYAHENSIVFTTAPTFRQVKKVLWPELRAAHARAQGAFGPITPNLTELILGEKWFAFGLSADKPGSLQGLHAEHILGIVDEACEVPDELWQAIYANLSGGHARLLAIGNPTSPQPEFAQLFKREDVAKITTSAFDTPNFTQLGIGLEQIKDGLWEELQRAAGALPMPYLVNPEWVAKVYQNEGEDSAYWVSRVMAQFPATAADALIPMAWIEAAQHPFRQLVGKPRIQLGIDVARFGDDKTVISIRRGAQFRILQSLSGYDTNAVGKLVVEIAREHKADIIAVDVIGVGGGVVDTARAILGKDKGKVVEINSAEKPFDERFANKRAEMFWNIRDEFKNGKIEIWPMHPTLAKELAELRYFYDKRGRIAIEDKAEMKARLGFSPDHADSLAYCFANERSEVDQFARAWSKA